MTTLTRITTCTCGLSQATVGAGVAVLGGSVVAAIETVLARRALGAGAGTRRGGEKARWATLQEMQIIWEMQIILTTSTLGIWRYTTFYGN